jgi:tetratricopeptide (TPR) repeat protein
VKRFSTIVVMVAVLSALSFGQSNPCKGKRDLKDDIDRWTRILEKDPDDVAALTCRGIAYTSAGNILLARKDFDRAIELAPTSAKAFDARGSLEVILGRHEQAVSDFSKAIQFDPNSGWAYFHRGRAYDIWEKPEQALSDYRISAELLEDGNFEAYSAIGRLYVGIRQKDIGSLWLNRAIEILDRKIQKLDPAKCSEYLYRSRGQTALSAGRLNDAFRALNEALRQDPSSDDALFRRAWVYLAIQAPSQSLTDINRAIQLFPVRAEYYDFRAEIHDRLNNKLAAEADRAKIRELSGAK